MHNPFNGHQATLSMPGGRAGHWSMSAGQAMRLKPAGRARVTVGQGRIWATTGATHSNRPDDHGDVILEAGQTLWVDAGQVVVIEPWARRRGEAACFDIDPWPAG